MQWSTPTVATTAVPRLHSTSTATTPTTDAAAAASSMVRDGRQVGTVQPGAARINFNGVYMRGQPLYKPNSTLETPSFIVCPKFVTCDVCNLRIGYDTLAVRNHVLKAKHQNQLDEYEPKQGAITVPEVETIIEARKTVGKRKRKQEHAKQRKAAATQPGTPAVAGTSSDEMTDAQEWR